MLLSPVAAVSSAPENGELRVMTCTMQGGGISNAEAVAVDAMVGVGVGLDVRLVCGRIDEGAPNAEEQGSEDGRGGERGAEDEKSSVDVDVEFDDCCVENEVHWVESCWLIW